MKFVIGLLCGFFISSASAVSSISRGSDQKAPLTLTPVAALSYIPSEIRESEELRPLFNEDNSQYEQTDARRAHIWLSEEASKFKGPGRAKPVEKADHRLKFSLKHLSNMGADSNTRCSAETLFMILNFMSIAGRKPSNPDAALYAGYIGREKLRWCAAQFDRQIKEGPKPDSEWALDKFFATVLSIPDKANDKALLGKVASFKLDSMPDRERVCKAARTLNKLHRAGTRRFNAYLSSTYANDCERQVPQFFERVCDSDGDAESKRRSAGLLIVNSAVALGAKPGDIVSERTLKLNEYKRVCSEFPKLRQSIESEMKPVSKNKAEPEIVERPAKGDDDDFDSPGDAAYFEDLRRGSQEAALSKAMLLEEDRDSAGGLKFWKKWTQ